MKMAEDVVEEQRLEGDAFYASLGRAIARWASVEMALMNVFMTVLGERDEWAVTAAFFSVHSFHTKLQMTHAAMAVRFTGQPAMAGWQSAHNRLARKAGLRNYLAHAPVVFEPAGRKGMRLYIHVGGLNPSSSPIITGKQRPRYFRADLVKFEKGFRECVTDLGIVEITVKRALDELRQARP